MIRDEGRWMSQGFPMAVHCLELKRKFEPRFESSHYHEYIELLWGLEGETEVLVSGELRRFQKGELMILNSKEPHALRSVSPQCRYGVVKFLPQLIYSGEESVFELKYLLPFLFSQVRHPRVLPQEDPLCPKVAEHMGQILSLWAKREYGYELAIRGNILILFSSLLRSWHAQGILPDSLSLVPTETLSRITKAIDYASKHLAEVNEHTLARQAGFSAAYFSRCFRKVMNMNCATYLTLLRLNQAEKLLVTESLSVTEIAQAVGYSTSSHFSAQFKKHRNCTPSAFRALMGRSFEKTEAKI